jgi:hypothetical protein
MDGDHRAIHAPEFQKGYHLPKEKPACWTTVAVDKGEVTEGWPLGVKPGLRNPFHLNGRYCGSAMSYELWATATRLTPPCLGCARGRPAMLEQMEIDAAAPKVIADADNLHGS